MSHVMTPAEERASFKIKEITKLIESGKTVYFATRLRVYPINLKTLNRFRKSGYELFVARRDGLYMLSGKSYLYMEGCKITTAKE